MDLPHRTFDDQPAKREHVPVLLGLIGPSGSGKTYSALRLATGIQAVTGGDIYCIDTEARRALHYAEQFRFRHIPFGEPFGSLDYLVAIRHCVSKGAKVVIVDSMSHEHEGVGGCLDFQDQETDRLSQGDAAKRERVKMLAWQKPKAARRQLLNGITQLSASMIFCFRAKEKTKPIKREGKIEIVEMGFQPIAGDEFLYEMTLNCLLLPNAGGVPTWQSDYIGERAVMKLPVQFRELFAVEQPLSEDIGRKLAQWAAGGTTKTPPVTLSYLEEVDAAIASMDAFALRDWYNSAPQKTRRQSVDLDDVKTAKIRVMTVFEAAKRELAEHDRAIVEDDR